MKCRLVKLSRFSGNKASVYSVIIDNDRETLFDKFLQENKNLFLSELRDILGRLKSIGYKAGAREGYFKLNEGNPSDGVCALYDDPEKHLRLYCIRYGTQIVVLGGGGPKDVRALQDDEKLTKENYFLRWLSQQITFRIKEGDITFSNDQLDFLGDLSFQENEEDEKD